MRRTSVPAGGVREPRPTSRWPTFLLVVSLLLAATLGARADQVRAHLTWQRPVGTMCPSSDVLQTDVEQLMGRAVFVPRQDADLWVDGVAEDDASGVRIRLDVRDPRGAVLGTRELSAPPGECASLRRALSVVLALLLDQNAAVPHAAAPSAGTGVAGSLSLGFLTGTLPRIDAGVVLALSLDPPKWVRVRADASYWLPVVAETQRGVGASFQAFRAGLSVCPRLVTSAVVGLWLCTGVELGSVRAAPRELSGLAHQTRLLVQPAMELTLSVRVSSHSSLEAALGILANVLRPNFYYGRANGESASVYRPLLFGGILRVGLTID
jgi:hypothetical protein